MKRNILLGLTFAFIFGVSLMFASCGSSSGSGSGSPASLNGFTNGAVYSGNCIAPQSQGGGCTSYSIDITAVNSSSVDATWTFNTYSSTPVTNCSGTSTNTGTNTSVSTSADLAPATQCAQMGDTVSPTACSGAYYCSRTGSETHYVASGAVNTSVEVATAH